MLNPPRLEPVDYLVIGHISLDLIPDGAQIGGSVAYAACTAQALGLRVGIVTSWGGEVDLDELEDIPVVSIPADHSTTFENVYTPTGRLQTLHHTAETLEYFYIPEIWRSAPIVHLAPVANELAPDLVRHFDDALLGVTPQGWMREWDAEGNVQPGDWPESEFVLRRADALVFSREDLGSSRADDFIATVPTAVMTDSRNGAYLYTQGEEMHFAAPQREEVDATGAGDIFAAAFFTRLHATKDPVDAAEFANQIAAHSVTRRGLDSAPTQDEIYDLMPKAY
ncbi:MAG: ribokinase [Chloroflexi bacterium]|nr:ribokinase [Chloroflexota bacterium]